MESSWSRTVSPEKLQLMARMIAGREAGLPSHAIVSRWADVKPEDAREYRSDIGADGVRTTRA